MAPDPHRAVRREELAAWLVKVDPRRNELGAGDRLESRCVRPGYRADLVRPGDRVLLWVSGPGRGLRGLGRITDGLHESVDGPAVSLDLPVFSTTITDAELREAGVDDLEVQRMPAGSNPSWVSRTQWERLAPLLAERFDQA